MGYELKLRPIYTEELKILKSFDKYHGSQKLLFLLRVGFKEVNHEHFHRGSKEWQERYEKGVLTARHTRTNFFG